MTPKTSRLVIVLLVAASFVAGVFFYPYLPALVASHWDAAGEVNGYMGKFWGVFLVPVIMLGMFGLYLVMPLIDPLKTNLKSFQKYYDGLWATIFAFMLYVFGLQLAWNLGARFDFGHALIPALAALWYFLGVVLGKVKRNWFMGIRTPWTLSSDVVWEKTHALGGQLFKIAAVISLAGLFLRGPLVVLALVVPVLVVSVVTVVYSYVIYRQLGLK
jgi:uncharacterized membrane protein